MVFQHGIIWDRALELSQNYIGEAMTTKPAAEEIIPKGPLIDSLQHLEDANIQTAIATTDNRAATEAMIGTLGLAMLFADIRCGDDAGPVKPDTAVLESIAMGFKLKVADLIMVGDTVSDLAMARKAGAALCVGVTGGAGSVAQLQPHADVLIEDIGQIRPA